MIRLYLDWNILNQMKNGYFSDLYNILKFDNRFIIFYSTAHIDDIFASYSEKKEQQVVINADLQFISDFSKNNCILKTKESAVYFDIISPHKLFENRIESEEIIKNFSIDNLAKSFDNTEFKELAEQAINLLKYIPININLTNALNDSQTSKYLNILFPNLNENPNFGDLINSFMEMVKKMNNDTAYDDLRKIFQNGLNINRDKIFDSKNPFDDLVKLLYPISNNGIDGLQEKINEIRNINVLNWFDTFANTYINLDIAGFQEDKIGKNKNKKQTFKNTMQDAFHSAFASACDIYILNDKRGYRKSIETYKHFNINTKVFKPY